MRVALLVLALITSGCVGPPPGSTTPEEIPSYQVPQALGWIWDDAAPLPRGVTGAACTSDLRDAYVIGGVDGRGLIRPELQVFHADDDQWSPGGALPVALHGAGATTAGGLRVIGGYRDVGKTVVSAAVYERNVLDFWDQSSTLPRPTAEAAIRAHGAQLYVIGGTHDGHTPADTIYVDARGGLRSVWSEIGPLATPRAAPAVAILNDTIVLSGGWGSSGAPLRSSQGQDGDGKVLWDGPAVPTPRSDTATATIRHLVFLIGGAQMDGPVTGVAELLDLDQGVWWSLPPLPEPRAGACAFAMSDGVHIVGGRDADGAVRSEHWVLRSVLE